MFGSRSKLPETLPSFARDFLRFPSFLVRVGVTCGVSGVNNLFVTRLAPGCSLLDEDMSVVDAAADASAGLSEPDPVRSKILGVAVFTAVVYGVIVFITDFVLIFRGVTFEDQVVGIIAPAC